MKEIKEEEVIFRVGSNAEDNWKLLQNSKQNWIWFHLDKLSSPYVVITESIKTLKNKKCPMSLNYYLNFGAELCKENSKYKKLKVSVTWTEVKNVSKGTKVGSAIIKGKRNIIVL